MTDIIMPRLSDSMEEGTVLTWFKAVGDEVAVGDELVEIETDKANMVHEADVAGTLTTIVVGEGEAAAVGAVIAQIGERVRAADGRAGAIPSPGAETEAARDSGRASGVDERVKASPLARRLARERGIELAAVSASGPAGRITKADVERALDDAAAPSNSASSSPPSSCTPGPLPPPAPRLAPPPAPVPAGENGSARGEVEMVELTKLQSTVSRRMAESKATAPHFSLEMEIDMSRAFAARAKLKAAAADDEVVPSFNDMVIKACALALREHPRANGAYRDGKLELYSRVNVGVAVATGDALVVPTIFDADRKGLRQIAVETRSLASRVRDATITPPELSGGTFTVSNLGMFGISNFSAVINPPQAGILAVGEISARPVVRSDGITAAQLMAVNLACDHRILYGADGAVFLGRVRALLEEPLGLAL